jgi:glycine dehydrogenase subunit 2
MGPDGLSRASRLAVLNANYLRERLKGTLHLAYDRPCMHECVFSDRNQQAAGIATLDMAKRLMDYGYHPPTIYFPLIVHGAIMIEPTETETKEELDRFVGAFEAIVREARDNPQLLRDAPHVCRVRRLDETEAARNPCLTG